ncbi:hypothetical protein Pla108_08440 [Botrimarina colliarenosi]|uniref:Uncharacterized protein n=1 Tax=Botrimarina colliarenosi TaxID=2528001 RepID=A0A5C6ALJ3_9BACT|nr:hypothetical protein [Botrimarina colliarenosi]TWT99901.1 hypothetical protein Pla108_08440 [Botrimarina colliarenosi]
MRLPTLLWVTALVSAYLVVAQRLGYPHAAVLAGAFALVAWSLRSRLRKWFYVPRGLALLVGSIVLWIGGVDGRWVLSSCPDCGWGSDRLEFRVLGFPGWSIEDDFSDQIHFDLRDLGWVCRHANMEAWVKHRYWGGYFCTFPCMNGCGWIVGTPNSPAMTKRVKASAAADPDLAYHLHKRYFREGQTDYFWDGLRVDWRTLAAYDEGMAREASDWLANAPEYEREQILESYPEITTDYIDSLYTYGVDEVIIVWQLQQSYWHGVGGIRGWIALRLPIDEQRRRSVFRRINERRAAEGYDADLEDFGQQFAHVYR